MDKKIEKFNMNEPSEISYSNHTEESKKIDITDFDNMSLEELKLLRSSLDVVIRKKQKEELESSGQKQGNSNHDLGMYSNYFEKIVSEYDDYKIDEKGRKIKTSSR